MSILTYLEIWLTISESSGEDVPKQRTIDSNINNISTGRCTCNHASGSDTRGVMRVDVNR